MDIAIDRIPSHVPPELVVDFDYYDPPGLDGDIHLAWKRLHNGPDIFWTPQNGGHWIVTRGDDIEYMQRNHELFSNSGMTVPKIELPYRMIPSQLDPPELAAYRAMIQPLFLPGAIDSLEQDAREIANSLIDGFHAKGECEFVAEFALCLPIAIFLKIANLPLDDREELLGYTERSTRGNTPEIREQAGAGLMAYLEDKIVERRANPGKDLISWVVNSRINGQPITDPDIRGTLFILLFGGLDTIGAMLGFFARFLADHPGHRRQLIAEPSLVGNAVEELVRRHGVASTGREVTRDLDYKGVRFRKGDLVWVQNLMHGLDERRFENPLEVDFNRKNLIHASFGIGIHRCPGSYLARTELKIFLQEWLKRIPDFRVKPGEKVVASPGAVNSLRYLPLQWDVR